MRARLLVLTLAFLTGALVMVAELAAPRLVAPHLGTSALTWTAVIATFLAGIALGNAWGGRLADRGRRRTLALLFLGGAIAVAAIVPLDSWLRGLLADLPHGTRTLLSVALTFGPAALLLGAAPPTLGRAALATGGRPGRALGEVAAASAIGSVVGTFLTGFALVPTFGTRAIHYTAAGLLALLALPALRVPVGTRISAREPVALGDVALPKQWWALAALAGFSLLVIEIVAGRAAAIHLGTSIYTWTAVIGVVLIGLSIGNLIGGRLADRRPPRALLGTLLLVASAATATCLWTPALMDLVAGLGLPWALTVLLATTVGFASPAIAIGTLTPVVLRAALRDPAVDGRVVGWLYAVGTLGAVAGALLTPFALVPVLHIPLLVILVSLVLAAAAGRLRGRHEWPWMASLIVLGLLARLPMDPPRAIGRALGLREDAPGIYVDDSRYFHIVVAPYDERWVRVFGDVDAAGLVADPALAGRASWDARKRRLSWRGPMSDAQFEALSAHVAPLGDASSPLSALHERASSRVRYLSLDRLVHGFVDLGDPSWLEYDYERLYAAVVDRVWPAEAEAEAEAERSAYFIGGGTYTFQRRLFEQHAHLRAVTAEIDPAVTRAAIDALGLEQFPGHVIAHEDARTHLASMPDGRFDLVFGDAFHDVGVPWHLTTRECAALVHRKLRTGGLYLINVVDVFAQGRFLGAMVATLESEFSDVVVLSMGPRDDDHQETFVVAAWKSAPSSAPRPSLDDLTDDHGRGLPVVAYTEAEVAELQRRGGNLVLTDDFAPVEALLAPVVEARGAKSEK